MKYSVNKLHEMETKYHLFEIGKDYGIPVWDLIRVDMYFAYVYRYTATPSSSNHNGLVNKNWFVTIFKWIKDLSFLFHRNRIVFMSNYRDVDSNGFNIDKILNDTIELVPKNKRLILGYEPQKLNHKQEYYNCNLAIYLIRPFVKKIKIFDKEIEQISSAFKEFYNIDISQSDILSFINYSYKQYKAWSILLRWLSPIEFISSISDKPLFAATRELNIKSFEFQHAGIIFDYPSYSYPKEVTAQDNLAWADYYVMFGDHWGINNNIPAKRLVLGNNSLIPTCFSRHFDKDYILVISDNIHKETLISYTKALADIAENQIIAFKLHPSEFSQKEEYRLVFKDYINVMVISDDYSLFDLIRYMRIMVLVYSSSFFEAMSLNKKVAIIKEDNYYLLEEFVSNNPNAVIVSSAEEIIEFSNKTDSICSFTLFDHYNYEMAKSYLL